MLFWEVIRDKIIKNGWKNKKPFFVSLPSFQKLLGRFYYVLMLLCKTRERGKIFARAVLSEARARFFRPS